MLSTLPDSGARDLYDTQFSSPIARLMRAFFVLVALIESSREQSKYTPYAGWQRALILPSSVKIKPHSSLQKTLTELKSKIF